MKLNEYYNDKPNNSDIENSFSISILSKDSFDDIEDILTDEGKNENNFTDKNTINLTDQLEIFPIREKKIKMKIWEENDQHKDNQNDDNQLTNPFNDLERIKKIKKRRLFATIKDLKKYTKKNFEKLIKILIFLLTGKEINLDFKNFTQKETKYFLFGFLHRKMNKKSSLDYQNFNLTDQRIRQEIIDFKQPKSVKRKEEKIKYCFKSFIKYFKENFSKKNEDFYIKYFKEISEREKIPLNDFKDPTSKTKKESEFNTYDDKYFKLICKSNEFVKDFINFLSKKINKVNYEKRIKKILHVIEKKFWNTELELSKSQLTILKLSNQSTLNNIIFEYLIHYQYCKLPWSELEIEDSSNIVISLIINNSNKNYDYSIKIK